MPHAPSARRGIGAKSAPRAPNAVNCRLLQTKRPCHLHEVLFYVFSTLSPYETVSIINTVLVMCVACVVLMERASLIHFSETQTQEEAYGSCVCVSESRPWYVVLHTAASAQRLPGTLTAVRLVAGPPLLQGKPSCRQPTFGGWRRAAGSREQQRHGRRRRDREAVCTQVYRSPLVMWRRYTQPRMSLRVVPVAWAAVVVGAQGGLDLGSGSGDGDARDAWLSVTCLA